MAATLNFAVKFTDRFDVENRRMKMNRTSLNRVSRYAAYTAMIFAVGAVVWVPLIFFSFGFALLAGFTDPKFRAAPSDGAARYNHFDRFPTNPASGLPMVGGVDTAGNPYGANNDFIKRMRNWD